MKVILKEEVDNLGLAGDVVDVANGYGRNYLIPRGLAIRATKGSLREAENLTRARKARESATLDTAQEYRDTIESRTLRIPARVDEKGHLYGSVNAGDVQRVLKERGHEIEQRRIDVPGPIKEIGEYVANVRLHPQITAEVPFEVVDLEGNVTLESLEEAAAGEEETFEERAIAAAEAVEAEEEEEAEEATELDEEVAAAIEDSDLDPEVASALVERSTTTDSPTYQREDSDESDESESDESEPDESESDESESDDSEHDESEPGGES